MQAKWIPAILLALGLVALSSAATAQTDLAASLYGAFSQATNGNGTVQSPANAAGGLLELRHIANPLIGYEATYSFNRANQSYSSVTPSSFVRAGSVPANAHEVTGDWVVSVKLANLRPFALAGGGVLFAVPSNGQVPTSAGSVLTSTSKQGVFVYGAGLDWGLLPHLGVRLQYRGNLYKAPNLTGLFTSTGAFTHTAEPMIGIFLRL
jgi:opacity protein-like surface antigen